MNRDWFAQTQPETAGKLALLWKYPPQLFVDEHEMGGTNYFFPPDSDPIYAETPDPTYHEIANLYGGANAAAFTRTRAGGTRRTNPATTSSTRATATPCRPPSSAPPA